MDKTKMMGYLLLYGNSTLDLEIPDKYAMDVISPPDVAPATDATSLVRQAISSPIGLDTMLLAQRKTAVIAINDKTRPVPHEQLLPPLLDYLQSDLGLQKQNISFLIASGTHAPMRPEEYHLALPRSILDEYTVSTHDCDDENSLISLGKTSRNTTIRINRKFMDAELKIVVGDIEPHHFAGFSGGVKTASIGLAARETILQNHAHLLDDRAAIACFDENPLRQDIEEIGGKIGVDLALNAILNADHEIVEVLFGSPEVVIHQGIEISRSICQTPVKGRYDLVIASGGGYPKDINFYQAQKAISHACTIVKDGGVVILAAECREGIGSPGLERFMQGIRTADDIPAKFQEEGFSVGPHKAFLLYRQLKRVKIILVSSLDEKTTERYFMQKAQDSDAAVGLALENLPSNPRIAVLPHAINTIPRFD